MGTQEASSPCVAALQYRAARGWVATLLAALCLHAPAGRQRAVPSGPPPWPLATPSGGRCAGGQVPSKAPRRRLALLSLCRVGAVPFSLCSTAEPAARPLPSAGWEGTCPPALPVGGGGLAPTATLGPLAPLAVGLAHAAAPPAGRGLHRAMPQPPDFTGPLATLAGGRLRWGSAPFRLAGPGDRSATAPAARHYRGIWPVR